VLTEYIQAAMRHARCEVLPEGQMFYSEIPELPGAWSNGPTLEDARRELQDVFEGWIAPRLALHERIPILDGIDITVEVPS
jgi:predicted RNase H-like HicB family nuclease